MLKRRRIALLFSLMIIPLALIFLIFAIFSVNNLDSNFSFAAAPVSTSYTVSKGVFYKNGIPIPLKGVNWFGFETPELVVHGLWARSYKDMISQMKGIGINAIRLPFCPKTLTTSSTSSVNFTLNPDLSGLNTLQAFDKIISELNKNQMYILLDMHRNDPNCYSITDLWYSQGYTETQWLNDLKFVAERYKGLEYFFGIDLKNEPHGAATWGTGNASTDWNLAAEKAGAAVLAVNPNVVIYVEGVGDNPTCSDNTKSHWWGGNLEPVNCNPISTAKIPANKLVLSPHVYGPDVYQQGYFFDSAFPNNMPEIWTKHFGYLINKGFTISVGEWGGGYGSKDAKDKIWQDALVKYMTEKKICNSFYWSWNANSGDTGGILKDDWKTLWDNKVNLLKKYWSECSGGSVIEPVKYSCSTTGTCIEDSNGTYSTSTCDNKCVAPAKKYSCNTAGTCAEDINGSFTNSNCDNQCSIPQKKYSCNTSGACVENSNGTFTTSNCDNQCNITSEATYCDVTYSIVSQWNNGFVADVIIKNATDSTIKNWNIEWNFSGDQKINNIWNGKVTQSGQSVSVKNADYNSDISSKSTTGFGFVGSFSGENKSLASSEFYINGNRCGVALIDPPPPPKKYSCNTTGACVEDSNGTYSSSNCDNACTIVSTKYCSVEYKINSQWNDGFVADVTIKNLSGAEIKNWKLTWNFLENQSIVNAWNGSYTQSGKGVSVSNMSYNSKIAKDGNVSFGFQGKFSGTNSAIATKMFKLNGKTCE